MKYRTKLLITFVTLGVLTNGISLVLMYKLSRHHLYDGYRAKMLSITASVAHLLDGDQLKTIQSQSAESTPAYTQLKATLRGARDANRRKDTYMQRMFTVVPSALDPKILMIAVDPEESVATAGRPGEVYRAAARGPIDIAQPTVEENFITDEFGTWLRSYAPVRDRSGAIVGAVIVEAPQGWVESRMQPIATSGLLALLLAAALTVPAVLFMSRRVSRPLSELHDALVAIGAGKFDTRLKVESKDEFGAVAATVNSMAAGLEERDRVKSAFARYVSHQVMDSILHSPADKLTGDRRRISVLFCDIRGFTTISENLAPEKVVQLLNEYFERMVEVVFRNKGTLDKFIGDGMMVIFGAPEDDPQQEEHALTAAIEMQAELRTLAAKWKPEGINLRVGIGIHSGPAIVGSIGSSRRMEYTAIGDTVNLASRLESATKELGVGILISEYTHQALRGSFRFKSMGSVQVRGRAEPVMTYSVEEKVAEEVLTSA